MRTIEEQRSLEKVVADLIKNVKEQEQRVGYLFWLHREVKK
jgi:hypothetical protein